MTKFTIADYWLRLFKRDNETSNVIMNNFLFTDTPEIYHADGTTIAHISAANTKDELLAQLSQKLNFPDYNAPREKSTGEK